MKKFRLPGWPLILDFSGPAVPPRAPRPPFTPEQIEATLALIDARMAEHEEAAAQSAAALAAAQMFEASLRQRLP